MDIYIFGAHSRARTLKKYLEKLYFDVSVQVFLVDNDELNPELADVYVLCRGKYYKVVRLA